MATQKRCKNCGWCEDPAEEIIFCNLYENDRNDWHVCEAWEPRDEGQQQEDAERGLIDL